MEADIYRQLADHLDRLGGFAPSESGAELNMLKELFTPEEAAFTTKLSLSRETASGIASRTGLDTQDVEQRLEAMAQKGLVFSVHPDHGPPAYQAVPWVVGMWEFQVDRIGSKLLGYITEWQRTRQPRPRTPAGEQMRVIPSVASVEVRPVALPYEMAEELVAAHTSYAVATCICRQKAAMLGHGCGAMPDACLLFGEFADFYVRTGRGRRISRGQVMEVLKKADESNLVLSPSNSKRIAFICCCCGCCCGLLSGLKTQPDPGALIRSPFVAALSLDDCTGCETCLERCQMEALTPEGDKVKLDQRRCIGCGLCVSTCPADALRLERRQRPRAVQMPEEFAETWKATAREKARLRSTAASSGAAPGE